MQEKITFDKFIRYSVVTVIFFLLYLLMRRLSNVLMPFFVAWFLAYLLHPVVCFFQYKCKLKKRILSILVTLLLIGLVLWLFYLLIVPPAAAEIERVKNLVTAYFASQAETNSISAEVFEWVNEHVNIERIISAMSFDEVSSLIEKGLPKVVGIVSTSISALVGILASLIAILYMIFILMDYEQMSDGIIKMFPKNYRPFVDGLVTDVKVGMNGYFRGSDTASLAAKTEVKKWGAAGDCHLVGFYGQAQDGQIFKDRMTLPTSVKSLKSPSRSFRVPIDLPASGQLAAHTSIADEAPHVLRRIA